MHGLGARSLTRFRDPGSLQRAAAAAMSEFIEVVISDDVCLEVRTDIDVTRITCLTSSAARSWLLCDAAWCRDA